MITAREDHLVVHLGSVDHKGRSEPGAEHGDRAGKDICEHSAHWNLLPAVGVSAEGKSEAKTADQGQAQYSLSIVRRVWRSRLLDENVFGLPSDVEVAEVSKPEQLGAHDLGEGVRSGSFGCGWSGSAFHLG